LFRIYLAAINQREAISLALAGATQMWHSGPNRQD
jgi:hypothetical protein